MLVTAVLALLLILYVFSGNESDEREAVARQDFDADAACTSREASELLKRELFRRAIAVRQRDDEQAVAQVAGHSSLRMTSAVAREHNQRSASVTCAGALVLDLPPGIAVEGGGRSLNGDVDYGLQTRGGAAVRLTALDDADQIVRALSGVGRIGSDRAQLVPQTGTEQEVAAAEQAPPAPVPQETSPPSRPPVAKPTRRAEAPEARPVRTPGRAAAKSAARPVQRQAATEPRRQAPPAAAAPTPPVATATVRPSFNCRYARTRGEIAVCNDAGLASLDRQMAAQFYGALARARPGQRALLQRSRNRFLAYRDSCGTTACMAEAYRARMQEISDIMNAGW